MAEPLSATATAAAAMAATVARSYDRFAALRTGRPHPSVVGEIVLDVNGEPTQLRSVARIGVSEPRAITVAPYDPVLVRKIAKAVRTFDIGAVVSADGAVVTIAFPTPSSADRARLIKAAKQAAEAAKVEIRGHRRRGRNQLRALAADGQLADADVRRGEDALEQLTGEHCVTITAAVDAKVADLRR